MTLEMQYYNKSNMNEYTGEWVALVGKDIVAHGKDLNRVCEEAEKVAHGRAFYTWVPRSTETLIL